MASKMIKKPKKLLYSYTLLLSFTYICLVLLSGSGYYISIYEQVPTLAFFAVITTIAFSICVSLFSSNRVSLNISILALIPLYLTIYFILVLPQLLGYGVLSGDALPHVGDMRDIISVARFPNKIIKSNIYPGMHLVMISTSLISGLPLIETYNMYRGISFLLYILILVSVSQRLGVRKHYALLFAPLTYLGMANINPSSFALKIPFLLALFTIYLWLENNRRESWMILLLSIFSVWIFHPSIGFFLTLSVLIWYIYQSGMRRVVGLDEYSSEPNLSNFKILGICVFSGLIWLIFWAVPLFHKLIYTVLELLLFNGPSKQYQPGDGIQETLFESLGFTYYDFLVLTLKLFGEWIVLFVLGSIGVIFFVISFVDMSKHRTLINSLVPIIFVLSGIWSVVELIVGIIPTIGYLRIARPAAIVSPILCGSLIQYLIDDGKIYRINLRILTIPIFCALIISGTLVGAAGLYGSPWTLSSNSFTTPSEPEGIEWYVEYTGLEEKDFSLGGVGYRQVELVVEPPEESKSLLLRSETEKVPSGFGYDTNETLLESTQNGYYIESRYSRIMNTKVGTTPFDPRDFAQLKYDPTVSRIYSNGNINVSYIGRG